MTVQIITNDPAAPYAVMAIDITDVDVSTETAQNELRSAVAEINPAVAYIQVGVETTETVTAGGREFTVKRQRSYYSLDDYFASLA
ncbi:hypothetical protein PBI_TRIKE_2 [Mycobacterium phage Trike]|uniref:hypothetical protein n=1 Tax=Mycobacterium phage Trike TaxID=1527536 RepID=UPI0004EF87BF|nr:hypothetical protein VC70_gp02 [Mycobacterium phage Trike]AIK69044.1 hypothetical protein PBI_TRIKE_2 [Mycobacterium phage Trike]QZD96990.1 hypothetical protein SEA_DRAKE94_3 [Mycobacterium phage Drake94]